MIKTALKILATIVLTLALFVMLLGATFDPSLMTFAAALMAGANVGGLLTMMWS